ncbi:hypothetical protein [Nonomuraea wenchangensis]|uniref:Uncharacterized protein n=1 Tax=Nonomuraea wenchangensis TaxID=568860 RepID=A0A1I0LU68_9ACTN|nr:hypothetical protein [Nonomuraea wenchangensis]SEU46798.1 hypothetical protein SAMN05421811_127146 [Nonomuraea wenchangensis]
MSKVYVKGGDVVTVYGKSSEAGMHIGFAGHRLEVEIHDHGDGRLYPAIRSKHSPGYPLTGCSMSEVAFYHDNEGGWFYFQDDADRAQQAPEWNG